MPMILNPDKEKVKQIVAEVKANEGFCPCLIEQSDDTKCKCKACREQEICVCGLFVKVENND